MIPLKKPKKNKVGHSNEFSTLEYITIKSPTVTVSIYIYIDVCIFIGMICPTLTMYPNALPSYILCNMPITLHSYPVVYHMLLIWCTSLPCTLTLFLFFTFPYDFKLEFTLFITTYFTIYPRSIPHSYSARPRTAPCGYHPALLLSSSPHT